MSKKGTIIQGTKFEKILLLVDVIIIIVSLACMIFAKPLGLSEEIVKYIIIFGTVLVVLIGLVVTGVAGDREDEIEEINEQIDQKPEEKLEKEDDEIEK